MSIIVAQLQRERGHLLRCGRFVGADLLLDRHRIRRFAEVSALAAQRGLDGRRNAVIVMTNVIHPMTKTLQVRVDEELRSEADGVLREIGMDLPSAVRLFLTKVVQTRSIPFELTASPRVAEVGVDAATQAKMDGIGALWSKRKARRA